MVRIDVKRIQIIWRLLPTVDDINRGYGGKIHRFYGPALIFSDGEERWYLYDVEVSEGYVKDFRCD